MGKIVRVKNLEIGQGRPKVCGIVLGRTAEEILSLAEKSNESSCELIEFRADYFEDSADPEKVKSLMRKLKRIVKKPVIFTFRRTSEGGKTEIGNDSYKKLLLMIAEARLAEIIDVEMSAIKDDAELIPKLKDYGAYVIMSVHDFSGTPKTEEIIKTFIEMDRKGADIIKAAYMPNSKKDVISLINASEEVTGSYSVCPVVAISMGHLGMITRMLGEFMDSAITFASITEESAPGQVNVEKLKCVMDIMHECFKRVFLIGFMGTGKTAIANTLALNHGFSKIDLDAYIEQKEHRSIADIFSTESEEIFRDKETKYLRRILTKDYQVISLGGGILLRDENVKLLKERGFIVLLTAEPETIARRLKNDKTRPLIGDNLDLEYITGLMKQREERYNSIADLVIKTDDRSIEDICKEIVEKTSASL